MAQRWRLDESIRYSSLLVVLFLFLHSVALIDYLCLSFAGLSNTLIALLLIVGLANLAPLASSGVYIFHIYTPPLTKHVVGYWATLTLPPTPSYHHSAAPIATQPPTLALELLYQCYPHQRWTANTVSSRNIAPCVPPSQQRGGSGGGCRWGGSSQRSPLFVLSYRATQARQWQHILPFPSPLPAIAASPQVVARCGTARAAMPAAQRQQLGSGKIVFGWYQVKV